MPSNTALQVVGKMLRVGLKVLQTLSMVLKDTLGKFCVQGISQPQAALG